jgi:rhodanese-related sulfurtransferase
LGSSGFPDRLGLRASTIRLGAYRLGSLHDLQDVCHTILCTLLKGGDSLPLAGLLPGGLICTNMGADYTPQEVSQLQADGEIQLIDVRQLHEHEAGRIAGDRLIELGSLSAEAHTISRDAPVVFYCRSGARSAMATQAFAEAGYDAHNMAGGLLAWDAAGLPLDPEGGYVDVA